ncbi:MAG: VWA domain-containing protein [Chitinivibrionales bacterium]|nr:VWA domain-containing protein [Chitinivibrionales bacterium]MBD3355533.1 VWA domain-containing protein [Chitinivibrionales bacterium]
MRFATPNYFWLLLLIPVLIGFFIWTYQRKQAALARFASLSLLPRLAPNTNRNRHIVKWTFFLLFFTFMVWALARPQFGVKMEMIERRGVDVIVALDVSKSMLAEDIAPSRLERAKHEIGKLIDLLRGDRIGLIVFAGHSYVQCPLTLDYGAAEMFLDVVTTDWISVQGTALADAIRQSTKAFRSEAKKYKVLVLLSDGEDHEGDAVDAAQKAAKEGVRIYTVGIGSQSGAPIPIRRRGSNVVYKKDKNGDLVMTRLNPVTLEKIALEGNGKYFHARTNLDLVQIYDEIASMEKKELGANKVAMYEERYQLFLLCALVFLLLEFFVPERVKRKEEWRGRVA